MGAINVDRRGLTMARIARAEVFSPDEVAIVHVMNRVVRRCFLLGTDPVTGKNFDHRKAWIERYLQQFAASFGIDLLGFAILSNHFHLMLRSRPDVVATWSDTEVARRWLMLCPIRKDAERDAEEPNEMELNSIRNDPLKLEITRLRLSDIGWWMRLLCQHIATRANHEDQEVGKFWQSRFRAVRLMDEAAVLACAAYVDLNPIRAKLAKTLESSDFTSAQRRIQSQPEASHSETAKNSAIKPPAAERQLNSAQTLNTAPKRNAADRFLSPIQLHERSDAELGPRPAKSGHRCSHKGFLPLSPREYLTLLDWTARQIARGKSGVTPRNVPPIFQRLGFDAPTWMELVQDFGRMFRTVAGRPQTVDALRSRVNQHRFHLTGQARKLLTAAD